MEDEWGGIDKKIKSAVTGLNKLGIPTTGSCEGHTDHGSPAPWIKVTPQKGMRNAILLRKVSRLLDAFYENRATKPDIRFAIEPAHSGFWIHNGGSDYVAWRNAVNETAQKIKNGKDSSRPFSKTEKTMRKKKLPRYQAELKDLTAFLKEELKRR